MPSLRTELSKTREEEKRERDIISEKKKFVVNGKKFSSNDSVSHHHYSSNGGKLKKFGYNNSFVVAIKPQEQEKTKTKTKKKTEKEKENSKLKAKCCEKSSAPGKDISKDIDDAKRIEKFFLNHTYYNTIIIKDHPIPLSPSETDSSNYSFTTMESSSHSSSIISKRSSNRRTNTNHHHTTNEDDDDDDEDLNPTETMVLRASKVDTNEIPTRNELGPRDIEHQGLRIVAPLQRKPSELETNLVSLHNEGIRYNDHNNDEYASDSCISDSNVHCHDDIQNTPNMSKIVGFSSFHNASHDDAKESSQARLLSIDYIGMPSLTASKCDSDPQSMRSKSEGGGLRSAVRNLEAAFIGSQVSVSASQKGMKSRQKQVKHLNSESSKVSLDRGFLVSPVRSRNKQHENLRSILRAPHEFRGSKLHLRRNPSYIGVIPPLPLRIHNTTKSGMEKDIISCRQAMSHGYLQRITRSDGLPSCYTLTINDSDDMLLARPCEPGDCPSKENLHQSTYTFHGGKIAPTTRVGANGWKSWIRKDCHDKSLTNLAGEMKVLSKIHCESGTFPGENSYEMVSEFTLFDGGARIDVARSQSSRFLSSEDHKVYSTITLESNRNTSSSSSSLSSQRRSSTSHLQRYLASSARWSSSNAIFKGPFTVRHNASFNTWDDSDRTQSEMKHLFPPSNPLHNTCNNNNLELSAVVIKTPIHLNPLKGDGVRERSHSSVSSSQCSDEIACNDKEPCTIGYLQQSSVMQPSESCEESSLPCITMILPSQRHGLPNHGTRGPTSLIERWKSGGKCDCGGWDLGCGMMVCCNGRNSSTLSSNPSSCLDQNKSLHIYSQGRSQEVVLSLLLVQDGFFIVQFHQQLMSPLKAFATSVAVLHNKELLASATRTMMVNMKHLIETLDCDGKAEKQTRPRDLSISSDETDSLEACKDISVMWCPPYPPSPFGRA